MNNVSLLAAVLVCASGVALARITSSDWDPYNGVWNPLPADYQLKTAAEKQDMLWTQIVETKYKSHVPNFSGGGWTNILKNLKSLLSLKQTFSTYEDILPKGRPKIIHSFGVVGKMNFTVEPNSGYTGLFTSGSLGMIRLSLGGDPSAIGHLPGIAIKFMVDGHFSTNIVALHTLDGQKKDANFFSNTFRTWIPNPKSFAIKILSYWFSFTEKNPEELPVRGIATYDTSGNTVRFPNSPNLLIFKAVADLKTAIPSNSANDFRVNLENVMKPGPIFEVYAANAIDQPDSAQFRVGTIHLTSPVIKSFFGDYRLFFQHQSKFHN